MHQVGNDGLDVRVDRTLGFGAVDLGSILSRVKPMILKLVFTGAQLPA